MFPVRVPFPNAEPVTDTEAVAFSGGPPADDTLKLRLPSDVPLAEIFAAAVVREMFVLIPSPFEMMMEPPTPLLPPSAIMLPFTPLAAGALPTMKLVADESAYLIVMMPPLPTSEPDEEILPPI